MEFYTNERRQENMETVLKALEQTELDFNSLIFTFADIIHSMFLNAALSGQEESERETTKTEIADLINRVVDELNEKGQPQIYDMIALSNLLMDAIEMATQTALQRQETEE